MAQGYAQKGQKRGVRTREPESSICGTNDIKKPALVSFYGNIVLLKTRCPNCGLMSIVKDGIMSCCDISAIKPDRFKTKRESEGEKKRRHISQYKKDQILEQQGHRCIYCEKRLDGAVFNAIQNKWIILKIHFDHAVSWKYSGDSSSNNIVASCHICNLIKSDLLFDTLEQARGFILHRRQIKGYEDEKMPDM